MQHARVGTEISHLCTSACSWQSFFSSSSVNTPMSIHLPPEECKSWKVMKSNISLGTHQMLAVWPLFIPYQAIKTSLCPQQELSGLQEAGRGTSIAVSSAIKLFGPSEPSGVQLTSVHL